jgi:hypothetical protein
MRLHLDSNAVIHACDPEHFEAFERLLAQPDPPEMPRRTHIHSCDGEPERRVTRLPALLMAWLQRRHLAVDIEEPLSPACCVLQEATSPHGCERLRSHAVPFCTSPESV